MARQCQAFSLLPSSSQQLLTSGDTIFPPPLKAQELEWRRPREQEMPSPQVFKVKKGCLVKFQPSPSCWRWPNIFGFNSVRARMAFSPPSQLFFQEKVSCSFQSKEATKGGVYSYSPAFCRAVANAKRSLHRGSFFCGTNWDFNFAPSFFQLCYPCCLQRDQILPLLGE